ncbi:thiopeptide-type bacteriocin biosynthesis protein [Kitasatospora sp. NPDC056731]|uniref:thiopeptide-type bacteriocin biosynthesis protein n=1 Tax=Kitasatospora sp. NPDC056731 TaxID=3155422 RepID=UPI00341F3F85
MVHPTAHPRLERSILAVLTGTNVAEAATGAGIPAADLAVAAETYRRAGRCAIAAPPDTWVHVTIQPTDWPGAETQIALRLAPALRHAETRGRVTMWWYVRKHPYWRLRLHPGPDNNPATLRVSLALLLDQLQGEGAIVAWSHGSYEPETAALGGPLGVDAAHALFHTDSRAILLEALRTHHGQPAAPPIGRRELSILMCSAMLRAAGQEWTEQGDVWARVAAMRPGAAEPGTESAPAVADKIGVLLAADTIAMTEPGQALDMAADRIHAFAYAGSELADTAHHGGLTRGLRAVLAHMVVFHWNRAGVSTADQAVLARAARSHILGAPAHIPPDLTHGTADQPFPAQASR